MPSRSIDRPNVVVVFTDQQRWDASGLAGNPLDLMPNFDRLASAGTHIRNGFTCQPVCGPARSCLQTGCYASTTGCYRNNIDLPQHLPTLAQCFNNAGYHSGYIGKWHLSGSAGPGAVPASMRGGYQYWLAANSLESISDTYRCVVYDNDDREVFLPGYRVDALTDAAIRYIDRRRGDPFFLVLSHLEPHHQNHVDDYPPPHGYRPRYAGRWTPADLAGLMGAHNGQPGGTSAQHLGGYWGMVKRLDEALGRLNDALVSLDLSQRTIVLFVSDHGCHFKTRNNEYKRSCHESSIHVPMGLWGPGFDGRGSLSELVSLVDLPPTLLDAAGLPVPDTMQGRSILPLVRGQREGWQDDVFVQISETQIGRAVRTRRWKYSVEAPADVKRDQPSHHTYHEAFLYDLQHDPYELTNLIGLESHQPVAQVMRGRLLARMRAAGEKEPAIVSAESRRSGQRTVSEAETRQ